MKNNNFEKNITDLFNNYHPEIDNDEIWENIEPHLKKKKKRRFLIFWFLMGSLGLGLVYHLTTQKSEPTIEQVAEKLSTLSNYDNLEKYKSEINSETTPNIFLNDISSNENSFSNNSPNFPSPKNRSIVASKLENNHDEIFEKNILNEASQIDKEINGQLNNNNLKMPEEVIVDSFNLTTKKEAPIAISEETKQEDKMSKIVVEENPEEKIILNEMNKKEKEESEEEELIKQKVKPLNKKKWESYMQLTASPILPFKYLKDRRNVRHSKYVEERKDTEKQLEAFGVNFGLQFKHKKKDLIFVTNLEYQQLNEKFEQFETETKSESVIGLVTVTENAAGQIIASTNGIKNRVTTIERTTRRFNNARFINASIGIGRSWEHNNNGVNLFGGIDYNLHFSFQGTIINEEGEPQKYSRNSPFFGSNYQKVFKKKAGLGLWLAGAYNHYLTPRLQWVVAPRIQLPLYSVTQEEYELSQRYFKLNLDVGIKYWLNPSK